MRAARRVRASAGRGVARSSGARCQYWQGGCAPLGSPLPVLAGGLRPERNVDDTGFSTFSSENPPIERRAQPEAGGAVPRRAGTGLPTGPLARSCQTAGSCRPAHGPEKTRATEGKAGCAPRAKADSESPSGGLTFVARGFSPVRGGAPGKLLPAASASAAHDPRKPRAGRRPFFKDRPTACGRLAGSAGILPASRWERRHPAGFSLGAPASCRLFAGSAGILPASPDRLPPATGQARRLRSQRAAVPGGGFPSSGADRVSVALRWGRCRRIERPPSRDAPCALRSPQRGTRQPGVSPAESAPDRFQGRGRAPGPGRLAALAARCRPEGPGSGRQIESSRFHHRFIIRATNPIVKRKVLCTKLRYNATPAIFIDI